MPSSFYRTKVFLFHRKLHSYETKTLREDRTAAEKNMPLMGSAAGGESCGAGFFLYCGMRKGENLWRNNIGGRETWCIRFRW